MPPTPTLFGKISEILKSKSRRDSGPFFLVHKCHGVPSRFSLTCLKAGAHGRGRPRRPGPLPAAGRGRGTHLACCRLPVADHRQTSTLPRVRRTNDRVVNTPALTAERTASCPLRVRPAHRAQVCAGGGAGAVGSWPRRRGRPPGCQRVHPPVASARQSRAPALGRPAPSLPSDGA